MGKNRHITKTINTFHGVDLSSPPGDVSFSRSPAAPNMMPGAGGFPVKRMGYRTIKEYEGRINGIYKINLGAEEKTLIHAGDALYDSSCLSPLSLEFADNRSFAFTLSNKLWILDGEHLWVYGIFEEGIPMLKKAEDIAYVPTITISRDPEGGGVPFESFNLLGERFREEFLGKAYATDYCLSYEGLNESPVTVEVMSLVNGRKVWQPLTEGEDFTVERNIGKISFAVAPGASPIEGEDNVRVTAGVNIPNYKERINQCKIGVLFGVGGSENRLFITGSSKDGKDWFSGENDLSYWGEGAYCLSSQEEIGGYSRVGKLLATHYKSGNISLRSGELSEKEALFPIVSLIKSPGVPSPFALQNGALESLFLTDEGIFALTAMDVSGERYAERRSYFIDKALMKEDLSGFVSKSLPGLCLFASGGGRVYLCSLMDKCYEPYAPHSAFQYEWYYWDNVPIRVFGQMEGITFGTEDGRVCRFYEENEHARCYTDDGAAITAFWELPEFFGESFYRNKSLTHTFVRLQRALRTSVSVKLYSHGGWQELWREDAHFRYFSWSNLSWRYFTWNTDTTGKSFGRKHFRKAFSAGRIRFENSEAGEPFGLCAIGLEYTEGAKSFV